MKRSLTLAIPLLVLLVFSFNGCSDKCQVKSRYSYYVPVYSTSAEIKAATKMVAAREVKKLGRIYVKDTYLFVNEVGEGIHVFDNHDPSQPRAIGFLNIPGNVDMAVRGKTLYADSYMDLVVFDLSNIEQIKEIHRTEGLFAAYTSYGFSNDPQKGIVTSWERQDNVSVMDSGCDFQVQPWGGIYYSGGIALSSASSASTLPAIQAPAPTSGIAGSTARFALIQNYLYGLDGTQLRIVDITAETEPITKTPITVAWDAETLFPINTTLFIGARAGMYIFDVSSPEKPQLLSQYDHITSCDPVVVEGNYAYITLYSGGLCHVATDQLEVVDIKNLSAPKLISVFPMTNPHGVGIDNGVLFICDGDAGLKIFDASDPLSISQHSLATYNSINAVDVIPFNNLAIVVGSDGIYQYSYADIKNIKLLSQIPVVKQ